MLTYPAVELFLTAKKAGWADATYTNRWYHLTHFADACPDLPTEPEPIEAFLATISNPLYRYNHWCTVRQFYLWMRRRRRVADPCPRVEAPAKPKPEPYFLDEGQLDRLLSFPHPPREKALLYLLADTGMRIGEAHSITVDRLSDYEIETDDGPERLCWAYVDGKTGPRWVPVSPDVMDMVWAIAPADGPLWLGKRGPLTVQGLGAAVWRAFHRAGFVGDKMSAHRLRHTFCTLWDGLDSDGMAVVGHKEWRTWTIYKHIRPKPLAAAHRQHTPLARWLGF